MIDQRWQNLASWYRDQRDGPVTLWRVAWWFALGTVLALLAMAVVQGRW